MSFVIVDFAALGAAIIKIKVPEKNGKTKWQVFSSTAISMTAFWLFIMQGAMLISALYQASVISMIWWIAATITMMAVAVAISYVEVFKIQSLPVKTEPQYSMQAADDLISDPLLAAIAQQR